MRSGWSPPQLLDLSHLHDHHPSYILIVPQSAPHFLIISLPPTAPLVIRGSFPGRKEGEVLDPPGSHRWRILPNQQGFASNSPHSSELPAAFLLSRRHPGTTRPPSPPVPAKHSQSLPARPRFLPSSPQIFCPRPKPHVSPLVGLLASAQIWSVVIYSGLVLHQLAGEFPNTQSP